MNTRKPETDPAVSRNSSAAARRCAAGVRLWALLSLLAAPAAAATYTWNGGSSSWVTPSSWTPHRTSPANDDVLVFDAGGATTATNVPTQAIGQIQVANGTVVLLQASSSNTLLTIRGDAGTDLAVPAGSALNVGGGNTLRLFVGTGATASVSGAMTLSTSAHTLDAADAGAVRFESGAVFTQGPGCTGNVFTAAGTPSCIAFAAGATFVSQAGSHPFGLGQPNSKVVFEPGSLYRHEQTGTPSFSGRTYADFELNVAGTISGTGGAAVTIGDLTVTQGTLNLGMLSAFHLKGDVTVASGQTLAFNPAVAATATFDGVSPQSITNPGTLSFSSNQNVTFANPAGVTLNGAVTFRRTTTVLPGAVLAVAAPLANSGSVSIQGTFRVLGGGGATGTAFTYSAGSWLEFADAGSSHAVSGGAGWPVANGPPNVAAAGAGLTMSVARSVSDTFRVAAPVVNGGQLTLAGLVRMESGGSFTGSPSYGPASTVEYRAGGVQARGDEWAATTSQPGYPARVRVTNGTTLDYPAGDSLSRAMSGDLVVDAGSALRMDYGNPDPPMAAPLTVAGDVDFWGTLALGNGPGGDLVVGGDWTNHGGVLVPNGRTVRFAGSAPQNLAGAEAFAGLELDNPAGLLLAADVSVSGPLVFTQGRITTGSNTLSLGDSAVVNGAGPGRYVAGNLRKPVLAAAGVAARTFEIGDAAVYAPVLLEFPGTVLGDGAVTASTTAGDHPQFAGSGLDPDRSVNRHWSFANATLTFSSFDATLHFDPADVDAAADTAALEVARRDVGGWHAESVAERSGVHAKATAVPAFGDFAIAERARYSVTASSGAGGSIEPAGLVVVRHGDDLEFTITPDTCYSIADVLVDGVPQGAASTYTFTDIQADHTISATFALDVHILTATAGSGGTIVPAGAVPVDCGASQAFAIAADPGYVLEDVRVDGVSVGAVSAYEFAEVRADHTIAASFTPALYVLDVVVAGGGSVTRDPDLPSYAHGTSVQLAAVAAPGWHFVGWSGDTSGLANPIQFVMTGPRSVTATFLENRYTWIAAGPGAWTTSTNWTPARFAPASDDLLIFDAGSPDTVTGVPAQTIGRLRIAAGADVTVSSAIATTLAIAGGDGADLEVEAGATLSLAGASTLQISLAAAATGTIAGTVNVSGAAHRLLSAASGALVFAGGSRCAQGAGFSGNLFGTTSLNSVTFASGSLFTQAAGSNPFGAAAPNAVVVFQPGSRYRLDGNVTPSISGRTYGDFEHNTAGPTTAIGGNPVRMDSLVVTQGVCNLGMTGGFEIRGDVAVHAGATLNFNASGGTPMVTLSGAAAQTIAAHGSLTTAASQQLQIANPAGVHLATDVPWSGAIVIASGRVVTGSHALILGAGSPVSGASQATGWIDGNVRRTIVPAAGARKFDVGDANRYAPVTVTLRGLAASCELVVSTAAPDHPALAGSSLDAGRSLNRWWTLAPAGTPSFTDFDLVLGFEPEDVDAGADPLAFTIERHDGAAWSTTTAGLRTATSAQATGVTAFGDFAAGEPSLHTVVATAGAGGSIDPVGALAVPHHGGASFTITPDTCFAVADVLVDGVSVGAVNGYAFTDVTADHTISATFARISHTIQASAGSGGSVLPAGSVAVDCGADLTFSIAADPCYTLADVLVDGVSVGAVTSYTFTAVAAGHTLAASFTLVPFTITATAMPQAAIAPAGGVVVGCGASQEFTIALVDSCYSITALVIDGVEQPAAASYTFAGVSANHTIDVVVTRNLLRITATAGFGGGFSPYGDVDVPCGSDTTFVVNRGPGFDIADVLVDGVSIGIVESHTFTNVRAAHTIYATFADTAAPVVQVTAPNGGENLHAGSVTALTWTATDNSLPPERVNLFVSRNLGLDWEPIAENVPNTGSYAWMVSGPATSSESDTAYTVLVRVTAQDFSLIEGRDESDTPFSIFHSTVDVGPVAAAALGLGAVRPNPARARVRIEFGLAEPGPVDLRVLDVQGRVVAELAGGSRAAGRHEAVWEPRSAERPVPAGIYFVRLRAGGRTFVRRVAVAAGS